MKSRLLTRVLFVAALSALPLGCASPGPSGASLPAGVEKVVPGETIEFEGQVFQLRKVQEDYVLLRYKEPGGTGGGISGFVDEVFRVCRYDLGNGSWMTHRNLPGVYLQWLGLDSFALARDRSALGGTEVVMLQ